MNRFRFLLLQPVFGGKVAATAPQWLSSLIETDMWQKKDSGACRPWTQVTFFFTFLSTVICKNTYDHLSSWEANFLPIECCCSHNRCKQHLLIYWFFFACLISKQGLWQRWLLSDVFSITSIHFTATRMAESVAKESFSTFLLYITI